MQWLCWWSTAVVVVVGQQVLQDPTVRWTQSIGASPSDFFFSTVENRLYVFGYGPARIVTIIPETGNIETVYDIPARTGTSTTTTTSLSFGITRGVAVHETDENGVEFAVLMVDDGPSNDDVRHSRIVCYDFQRGTRNNRGEVRWEFNVGQRNLLLPTRGKPAISDNGLRVYQHFSDGDVYCLHARLGVVLWQDILFPMAGFAYHDGRIYGGVVSLWRGRPIRPGMFVLDAEDGAAQQRWRAPQRCLGTGDTFLAIAPNPTQNQQAPCNNVWTNPVVASRNGDAVYVIDDVLGLARFDPNDIGAGPVWSVALGTTIDSQQSYTPPVLNHNETVVYASVFWTRAAVDAATGQVLWSYSQNRKWASSRAILSPSQDLLYTPFGLRIHAAHTTTGGACFSVFVCVCLCVLCVCVCLTLYILHQNPILWRPTSGSPLPS